MVDAMTPKQLERLQRGSLFPAGFSDACDECGVLASDIRAAIAALAKSEAKLAEQAGEHAETIAEMKAEWQAEHIDTAALQAKLAEAEARVAALTEALTKVREKCDAGYSFGVLPIIDAALSPSQDAKTGGDV